MLEWYRAGETYEALMRDCGEILALAAETAGTRTLAFRGRETDPFQEPERLSVAEAFERFAGIDLLATIDRDGATDRDAPGRQRCKAAGLRVAEDDTWSDLFSRVIVERVEPNLGLGRATILDEYPVAEAALARPTARDPRVAERFELYACGVELANAFGELTDAAEQRRRFEAEMAEKMRVYGESYPMDEDFLAALAQHAGGERHRARLRPAGDAGDRRLPHRAGALGAGAGDGPMNAIRPLRTPAELVEAGLVAPEDLRRDRGAWPSAMPSRSALPWPR